RVVFMASGGLSHNPPVPSLATAPPEVVERLLDGRHVTPQQRSQREARTMEGARRFASGQAHLPPIKCEWDQDFLQVLKRLDMAALDALSNTEITERAGNSGHEVKTWIAANAAMSAATGGRYEVNPEYYRAIPEWIAGFATLQGAVCR